MPFILSHPCSHPPWYKAPANIKNTPSSLQNNSIFSLFIGHLLRNIYAINNQKEIREDKKIKKTSPIHTFHPLPFQSSHSTGIPTTGDKHSLKTPTYLLPSNPQFLPFTHTPKEGVEQSSSCVPPPPPPTSHATISTGWRRPFATKKKKKGKKISTTTTTTTITSVASSPPRA